MICNSQLNLNKVLILGLISGWGLEIATCPSCSLIVKVIYDIEDFEEEEENLAKEFTKAVKVEN